MNDEILQENLEKTFQQIDAAAEIWVYALRTAEKLVDTHLPCYQQEINKAILPHVINERIESRQEAVSTVLANLLSLSEGIRI